MPNDEQIEKIRQAIMRYRELLDLLHLYMGKGERDYAALFDALPPEQHETLEEKALQREAARVALDDLEPLRRAALKMQFDMREMERAFEDLYGNIAPEA